MRVKRGVVLLCILFMCVPTFAIYVENLQFALLGGNCFYIPMQGWHDGFFLNHEQADGSGGTIDLVGYDYGDYLFGNLTVSLSSSELLNDTSYTQSSYFNPKIARGEFASGAILTIEGSILENGPDDNDVEIFNGTILEAIITVDFDAQEQTNSMDAFSIINAQLHMNITGGELEDGAVTGFVMYPEITTNITLLSCSQYGNPGLNVEDFQSDMSYISGTLQVQPTVIPEPATVALLTLGAAFMIKKKRRIN